ncbi:MAG TPA: helix-turn-helix domain-containing protein [Actinocrinis sp.]|jgi:AcrR family transcriptional regulator
MAPEPDDREDSLRERKKAQTRSALRESAARLFAARGFAETTIAEIAEHANVSKRTFFRYFESKEELLLPDLADLFGCVEAALAGRPPGGDAFDDVRAALLAAARPFAVSSLTALTHPIEGADSLVAARLVQAFTDFEERLTGLVRARLPEGVEDPDLRAAVVAGAALSAVRATLRTQRARRSELGGVEPGVLASPDAQPVMLLKAFDILAGLRTGEPEPGAPHR